jgi:hypothetical protein
MDLSQCSLEKHFRVDPRAGAVTMECIVASGGAESVRRISFVAYGVYSV